MGHGVLKDHMINDGLWDHVNDFHMGISNDLCAEKYGVTREDQDRYAAESYRRALSAIAADRFRDEILPVTIPQRKGDPLVSIRTNACGKPLMKRWPPCDRLSRKTGTATAGNASIISDGAAAVVVMAREKAEALGLPHHGHDRRPGILRDRDEVRPGGPHLGRSQMPGETGHHHR